MPRKEQGTLALFDHPEGLVNAIDRVRKKSIKNMESFTPFPIHEVIHAMGIRRSWIPWATLLFGLIGCFLGFFFQAWTLARDWPVNIGGKPPVSWPAYIPITFETTVLSAGVLTTLILLAVCQLPNRRKPPLDLRLTDNLFGLFVGSEDPHFNEPELHQIFRECNAKEIQKIG